MNKPVAFLGIAFATFITVVSVALASQSSYTASGFSQYCAGTPTTCKKENFDDARVGTISCPSTNQIIDKVYVHAGSGQIVWELPDSKFSYSFSNNQNTVTVNALEGTHDISWIGVTCSTPTTTPTPTQTPTPTVSPTITPTVTPTATPTATPTPNIVIDCPGQGECEVIIGGSPTPTATPTATPTESQSPTATPTPGSSNGSSDNNSSSSSSSGSSNGQVLGTAIGGVSTLAATGTAAENISFASFVSGILFIAAGILNHVKKTKTFSFWS